jgi:acyl-coenzyme A thioesterase PaaI-like protein
MYSHCFVCGSENQVGLHISFTEVPGDGCRAEYTARAEHEGWPEVIHGGILFTLMDEAVAWATIYAGLRAVTAKAEVRYRVPARVGMPLVIRARLTAPPRRTVQTRAEVREGHEGGLLLAELDAVMVVEGRVEDGINA